MQVASKRRPRAPRHVGDMAEMWALPPSTAPPHARPSSTTLLLRRLPAGPELVRQVLTMAGTTLSFFWSQESPEPRALPGPEGQDKVYVLVDVGAAHDNEPLAAALATYPPIPGEVVLAAVAVVAPWRGRGLGGRLLGEVVDELRAEGVLRVWAALPTGAGHADDTVCARLFLGSRSCDRLATMREGAARQPRPWPGRSPKASVARPPPMIPPRPASGSTRRWPSTSWRSPGGAPCWS